jgi:hypothetical protein
MREAVALGFCIADIKQRAPPLVTATVDSLAADILNGCGRAYPAFRARPGGPDDRRRMVAIPRLSPRAHRDTVRALNDGVSARGAEADIPPTVCHFRF